MCVESQPSCRLTASVVARYAQRMLIENNISESIQFFHLDALSSMVGLKVDFDLQLTLMAGSLYRLMAQRIGREYTHAQPKRLFRNLLASRLGSTSNPRRSSSPSTSGRTTPTWSPPD